MTPIKGSIERRLIKDGIRLLGIDEVGRGCIAGPVYAACVAIDYARLQRLDVKTKDLIRDSKTLSGKQRQKIIPVLHEICLEQAIASASAREIETLGIVPATFLAMQRCYSQMQQTYDLLLIDGNQLNPQISLAQQSVVGGDGLCFAIAAASILAKEERDAFMRKAAVDYPHYDFQGNVGYGTRSHLQALSLHGITPLHRRNFAPISSLAGGHEPSTELRS